jgi:pyrroline-5-carboxylate reductase
MDAFTVAFSPTHGQHALAALARAGEKLGLSRELAQLAAAHALGDSISDWRARGAPPLADLLAEAMTPGGIAAETIRTLDRAGYSKSIEWALRVGMSRLRKIQRSATAL